MRVAATAPMLVEKEKPVPRAEFLQCERRAFLSLSIDPVGDMNSGAGCPAMLCVMAVLAILIAAGCTPWLRPHNLGRGTKCIAVGSAGKAMISITARNAARPAG
jgi:hypothetical protein